MPVPPCGMRYGMNLEYSSPDPCFWDRVRKWQQKRWAIALHGLHHVYHPIPKGARSLISISDKSEFVGLPLNSQRDIIKAAWTRLLSKGVEPIIFMAPSHAFDVNTLVALYKETDIRIITDGFSLFPFREGGFIWIPQQLWRFRNMPFGMWTVCLHPNTATTVQLKRVIADLVRYRDRIISVDDINKDTPFKRGFLVRLFELTFMSALVSKLYARKVVEKFSLLLREENV